MDKRLRAQVVNEVRDALVKMQETYEERWLSAKELCGQFQMFTAEWLRRYGYLLPRVQVIVTDEEGKEHKTGWAYARNKIARMIADGSLERLKAERKG